VHSKAYSLAKNDSHLKMTRIVFRYRNNMDDLFDWKPEPQPLPQTLALSANSGRRKSVSSSSNAARGQSSMTEEGSIVQYKHLQGKATLEFNGTKINSPLTTKADKNKSVALLFNKSIFNLCEGTEYTATDPASRLTLAVSSTQLKYRPGSKRSWSPSC